MMSKRQRFLSANIAQRILVVCDVIKKSQRKFSNYLQGNYLQNFGIAVKTFINSGHQVM